MASVQLVVAALLWAFAASLSTHKTSISVDYHGEARQKEEKSHQDDALEMRANCSSLNCPVGYKDGPLKKATKCAGRTCHKSDYATCCVKLASCSNVSCVGKQIDVKSKDARFCTGTTCQKCDEAICCRHLASCNTLPCGTGYEDVEDKEQKVCESTQCVPLDRKTCCKRLASCTEMHCGAGFQLKANAIHRYCDGESCDHDDRNRCCDEHAQSAASSDPAEIVAEALEKVLKLPRAAGHGSQDKAMSIARKALEELKGKGKPCAKASGALSNAVPFTTEEAPATTETEVVSATTTAAEEKPFSKEEVVSATTTAAEEEPCSKEEVVPAATTAMAEGPGSSTPFPWRDVVEETRTTTSLPCSKKEVPAVGSTVSAPEENSTPKPTENCEGPWSKAILPAVESPITQQSSAIPAPVHLPFRLQYLRNSDCLTFASKSPDRGCSETSCRGITTDASLETCNSSMSLQSFVFFEDRLQVGKRCVIVDLERARGACAPLTLVKCASEDRHQLWETEVSTSEQGSVILWRNIASGLHIDEVNLVNNEVWGCPGQHAFFVVENLPDQSRSWSQ